jgi:fibronectin type 3 domain-containing protein
MVGGQNASVTGATTDAEKIRAAHSGGRRTVAGVLAFVLLVGAIVPAVLPGAQAHVTDLVIDEPTSPVSFDEPPATVSVQFTWTENHMCGPYRATISAGPLGAPVAQVQHVYQPGAELRPIQSPCQSGTGQYTMTHDLVLPIGTPFGTYDLNVVVEENTPPGSSNWGNSQTRTLTDGIIIGTVPAAPTNLTAAAGPDAGEITLTWETPATHPDGPVTAYRLYAGSVIDNLSFLVETETLSHTHSGLASGATLFYAVSAVNSHGEGPQSSLANATTFDLAGAPLNLGATAGPGVGEISLVWDAPAADGGTPITGYVLYRGLTIDSMEAVATVEGTSHLDTLLEAGTTYLFAVSAVNLVGEGPASSIVDATTFDVPGAPLGLSATAGPGVGEISLVWDAPAADGGTPVTGYVLYRGLTIDSMEAVATVEGTSHLDTLLEAGTTYLFAVRAVNGVGEGPASSVVDATTFAVPGAVTDFIASAGPGVGEITLTWAAPDEDGGTEITGYRVFRGLTTDSLEPVADVEEPGFLDTGLANGTTYIYRVAALNAVGEGPVSGLAAATTLGLPGAPVNLSALPGVGEIGLSWEAGSGDGITGYRIYRGSDADNLGFLAESEDTQLLNDGLGNGATFFYAVSAVNSVGEGPLSAVVSTTTFDLPGAPQGLAATTGPGVGEISLAWSAPATNGGTEVTGYRLYRGLDAESLELLSEGPEAGFIDEELGNGVTLVYAVSAVNAVGEGPLSALVSGSTFDVPAAPGGLVARAGPGDGAITIEWDAPAANGGLDVTHYNVYSAGFDLHFHLVGQLAADAPREFAETELGAGVARYYHVTAANEAGESGFSNQAYGVTHHAGPPPPLPVGLAATSAIWQGHYVYVFGGFDEELETAGTIIRFDPQENEVIILDETLPGERHSMSAVWATGLSQNSQPDGPGAHSCHPFCFDGGGILFGGKNRLASPDSCHPACAAGEEILFFDVETGGVTPASSTFPMARFGTSAVWDPVRNLAYVFGGFADVEDHEAGGLSCHPACVGREVWSFDANEDRLEPAPTSMPDPLGGTSAVWDPIQNVAYIIGGEILVEGLQPQSVTCAMCSDAIYRFDPSDFSIELVATMPAGRSNTSAVWDGAGVLIFGGATAMGATNEVLRYDPAAGTVATVGELPSGRASTSAVWTGSTAFVFGGDEGEAVLNEIVPFMVGAPRDLRAQRTGTAGHVWLSWKEPLAEGPSGLTGYRLYRALENGTFEPIAQQSHRYFLDTDLELGATYRYRVSAIGVTGEGPQSPEASIITAETPGAPRFLEANPGPNPGEIRLQWYHPEDIGGLALTQYRVYRGTSPDNLSLLTTVGGNVVEFVDPVLMTQGPQALLLEYYYQVSAVNPLGEGARSETACSAPSPWMGGVPPPLGDACMLRD